MVGADGTLPLPWLEPALRQTLQWQHAHALLLHGPQGVGQFELALTLAQAWLCEAGQGVQRPCGSCAGCKLVQARSHPDLLVLLPEALQQSLGWGGDDDASNDRTSKAKPSKEIKVEAVRGAVTFAQTTSSRGRGKVVVLHPAERMNAISANSLLKTLEEPPGAARFVLSCAAPDALLPTIRSRCQGVTLGLPPIAQAIEWLARQGVAEPAVLLAASGGQPQLALDWQQQGMDVAAWTRLPVSVRQGDSTLLASWPLPRIVDALQKLCHDAACAAVGAAPRYFPSASVNAGADSAALSAWSLELARVSRHDEHAWNTGLMVESLVQQGQRALGGGAQKGSPKQGVSVHSRP